MGLLLLHVSIWDIILFHTVGCMLCSIKPLCYLASCRIAAWPRAVAFLMHYRISLHTHRRRMHRTRGKCTPMSSLHILPGGTLKLRIISWFKKLYIYAHICRTANRCISFPLKTNGKRYQWSYASAFVAVHFAHRWEHVTIPRDDILRDARHKQEHSWRKATWLTYESVKQSWTQARPISTPQPGSEPVKRFRVWTCSVVRAEMTGMGVPGTLQSLVLREVTYRLKEKTLLSNGLWY